MIICVYSEHSIVLHNLRSEIVQLYLNRYVFLSSLIFFIKQQTCQSSWQSRLWFFLFLFSFFPPIIILALLFVWGLLMSDCRPHMNTSIHHGKRWPRNDWLRPMYHMGRSMTATQLASRQLASRQLAAQWLTAYATGYMTSWLRDGLAADRITTLLTAIRGMAGQTTRWTMWGAWLNRRLWWWTHAPRDYAKKGSVPDI